MNEQQNKKEDSWAVEPPKKSGDKAGKVLRVALIVAALAAAAVFAGAVWYGNQLKVGLMGVMGPSNPRAEACVDQSTERQYAEHGVEDHGELISDDRP